MSKLLIIIISTIQMVVFDAFAIDQCLNEFLVVKAESQPRTSSAKIESQFRLSPEEGLAKNIVFSLANMHPLVTKSQIDIFKGMLESTSSNLVLLYGDNQSLADWQSDILRLLAPISPAHQARLIFVPTRVTNLAWARDFVPATVSNAYASHLVSFRYAKDEDLAKRTTEEMARAFGLSKPVYLDLFVDGGAYMIDSEGRLFISEIVKTRNKAPALNFMSKNQRPDSFILDPKRPLVSKTDLQIEKILKDSLGANEIVWVKALAPEIESTGHIDMYAKIINAKTVIIAQSRNPEIENILNQTAILFEKYGYQVIRLQTAKQNEFGFRSYTNSTIIGNTVFLPQYHDARADKAAVEAYRSLGFTVKTNDGSSIECGGSTHCLSQIGPNLEISH